MDVLCTDKTGTLTEARIAHVGSFDCDGFESSRVTELACLNSRFAAGCATTSTLLLANSEGDDKLLACPADLPFDFQRRRSSVLVARATAGDDCQRRSRRLARPV
jgi:Mg2+-importing ATPase